MRRWKQRTWWTRERVLAGLLRFYREHRFTPLSTKAWLDVSRGIGKGPQRPYPSHYAVLRWFSSFREAWTAAGVDVDRVHEVWQPMEDWYLREAAGFVPRVEIARDLRRSPEAVHRRLYDLGLHSYRIHGWSLQRVRKTTGVSPSRLIRYLKCGRLPYRRGTKCYFVDPADLLVVREIDWSQPPRELERAVRLSLVERLAGILSAATLGLTKTWRCA